MRSASENINPDNWPCIYLEKLLWQVSGELKRVKRALATDPSNPVALHDLGAFFDKEGDALLALYYLRQSIEIDPLDPQMCTASPSLMRSWKTIEPAQKLLRMILEMKAPEALRGLARTSCGRLPCRV